MIKPKHKDCGCLPSPRPVFSNSFPSIELTENQSYMPGFPSSRLGLLAKGLLGWLWVSEFPVRFASALHFATLCSWQAGKQAGGQGPKPCLAPSAAVPEGERSVKLGESQGEGYSPSGGLVELACGFQANVYLFAVYCNRAGLTLEAILCSVKNVHGTVPHLKKKKPARETTEAERKRKEGWGGRT